VEVVKWKGLSTVDHAMREAGDMGRFKYGRWAWERDGGGRRRGVDCGFVDLWIGEGGRCEEEEGGRSKRGVGVCGECGVGVWDGVGVVDG
jgi:hypothetical protein